MGAEGRARPGRPQRARPAPRIRRIASMRLWGNDWVTGVRWAPERFGPEAWHQLHEQRICRHTRLSGSSRQRVATRLQIRQL